MLQIVLSRPAQRRIERDYQDLKQDLGLGHYEGRGWRGLQWLGRAAGAVQASKSAISQARTRLRSQAMRQLAERVLRPLAAPRAPVAW